MPRFNRMIEEARAQQKCFDAYLNNLSKKSKAYLIGYIEGMLTSGKIKVEDAEK